MDAKSARWHRVTPSTFPWEDEAIDFLRSGLADADPTRAWSNFEFISGGVISEVDALLVTRKGAFLIEIKSTPGRLTGDQQTWTFHKPDGGKTTMENPLLGANRKAKRIKSLLEHKWRKVAGANASKRPPFVEAVVFLSNPDLIVDLKPDARMGVCGRDGSPLSPGLAVAAAPGQDGYGAAAQGGEGDAIPKSKVKVKPQITLPGILETVATLGAAEAKNPRFHQLNTPTAQAVAKALEQLGIKESNRTRTVGSWVLRLDTVAERPGIQDFVADHAHSKGTTSRVRIYSRQPLMSDDQAVSLHKAAQREFEATERLSGLGVVPVRDLVETDLGSSVVFEYDPTALRLDRWLADTPDLDIDDRLSVLRQLAETMQAVHQRKVTHRVLSPGSVLVRPGRTGEPRWVVLVTDFSLAAREHSQSAHGAMGGSSSRFTRTATQFGLPSAAPGDVELLADESALCFQPPEAFTDGVPDGISVDVFSYGAIAFTVIAGRAPGDSQEAVGQVLRAGRGLQLAAAVPGVADALNDLVLETTRPLVSDRVSSFDEVLRMLDDVEEELTAPLPATIDAEPPEPGGVDPLVAKKGERLANGSIVKGHLGRGSTALALLVEAAGPDADDDRPLELVYKVSLGGDADRRLREEGRILTGLRHPAIVELVDVIELDQRPVLVEVKAGDGSLTDELRRNGTPGVEFLHRWGSDLLEALRYLEREGRSHRDVKPDNLGVTQIGPNKEQHLVLFDFSLAAAPASDIRAGTPPYLEPFLPERSPQQWDLAAERYAAAVTLYEMSTGETPRWGDGQSDPSFTTGEATLDVALFDPAVRDQLEVFFVKALKRDYTKRFGNADEMLRAWQRVFEGVDTSPTRPDEADRTGDDGGREGRNGDRAPSLPESLSIDDPVVSLSAKGKVVSALARLDVATVRQLADLSPMQVNTARRISPRVRREVLQLRAAVLQRFADELAATPTPTAETATGDGIAGQSPDTETRDVSRLDLDALVPLLVPPASKRARNRTTQDAARHWLGLTDTVDDTGERDADWPTQAAIAAALDVTRGRIGQISPKLHAHWAGLESLRPVADDLAHLIADAGGVVGVRELEPWLVESLGSGLPTAQAIRSARAVIRAAIEADGERSIEDGGNRFAVRRRSDRVIVVLVATPPQHDESPDPIRIDGTDLGAYAAALGDRADAVVVETNDVVPQDRAIAALRQVPAPAGAALSDGRLLRLAAACSQHVGVSAALELYPAQLDPQRALRFARQGLASAVHLAEEDVRERVRARFPLVQLPARPELDALLHEAGIELEWSGTRHAYERGGTRVGGISSLSSLVVRDPTSLISAAPFGHSAGTSAADPSDVVAAELEGRLQRSLDHGGFLALRVPVNRGREMHLAMGRFDAARGIVNVDVEAVFLDELRAQADRAGAEWATVLHADQAKPGTMDDTNLRTLTSAAAMQVERHLRDAGQRVVAWNAGILVRYQQLGVIDRLRELAGRADSPLQTLWLVVFASTTDAKPMLDGHPVPVLGASEWIDLTDAWFKRGYRFAPDAQAMAAQLERSTP